MVTRITKGAHAEDAPHDKDAPKVMKFRLKASQHIGDDTSAKPRIVKAVDPDTGEEITSKIYPPKTYHVGNVIESEDDLVAKHGAEKFERIDGGDAQSAGRIKALQAEIKKKERELLRLKAEAREHDARLTSERAVGTLGHDPGTAPGHTHFPPVGGGDEEIAGTTPGVGGDGGAVSKGGTTTTSSKGHTGHGGGKHK